MDARCTNFGNCSRADHLDTMNVFQGGDLACPECGNRMAFLPRASNNRSFPITGVIAGLVVLICVGWLVKTFLSGRQPGGAASSASGARSDSGAGRPAAQPNTAAGAGDAGSAKSLPRAPGSPFACDPQEPAIVRNLHVPILTEFVSYDKMPPGKRASTIAARLNDCFVNDLKPPRTVLNLRQGNLVDDPARAQYVFFGYLHSNGRDTADIIATVDPVTAARCGVSSVKLACWWRDILRDWLLIDEGQSPQYTVPYTPLLMDFYHRVRAGSGDMSARFRSTTGALIDSKDEYEKLSNLSSQVPPDYKVVVDDYHPILNDDSRPGSSG